METDFVWNPKNYPMERNGSQTAQPPLRPLSFMKYPNNPRESSLKYIRTEVKN